MVKYILMMFVLVVVPVTQALAQESPLSLRLSDALAMAREAHPRLRMIRSSLDAAEARVTESRSALLPQVRFSGRASYLSDVPEFTVPFLGPDPLFPSINRNYGARLTLQQNLFAGFRYQSALEMTERGAEAVRAEVSKERAELALEVATAYWNLYRAGQVESVLGQSVEQIAAHLADVQNFRRQGVATDFEVLKVEAQLSEIRVRHIEARSQIRLAQMALNSLIGNPLTQTITPADRPAIEAEPPGLEEAMEKARIQRPEARAAAERTAMQEAALRSARGGWYPHVVLAANYDYARPNPRVIPPDDVWEKSWDVGIVLQWNLWDWFATSARAAQAKANLEAAGAMADQVLDAVALDAAQSYFRVNEAREKIDAAAIGTRQAEEGFRVTREKYRQGMASNADLLDAETALLQARLTETNAAVDYVIHSERLRKATGDLRE